MPDVLFAGDCVLKASSEVEMQQNMDKCSSACYAFGLTISVKKMEVMFQPAPHTNYSDPTITVKGQKLQTVDKFTYLGSTMSRNVLIDDEADARIAKARTAFGWTQSPNKAESLQSCSHDHSLLCLRNMDRLL